MVPGSVSRGSTSIEHSTSADHDPHRESSLQQPLCERKGAVLADGPDTAHQVEQPTLGRRAMFFPFPTQLRDDREQRILVEATLFGPDGHQLRE